MGTWYQAISTARYKLTFQPGLICEQTNYTFLPSNFDGTTRIAATYSSSTILPRLEAATLTRFSQSTDRICTAAKNICQLTTPPYSGLRQNLRALWHSIPLLSSSHPSIAAELQRQIRRTFHLIRLVECSMDSLSTNVSQIQQAYGRISIGQGLPRENIRQLTEIMSGTLRVVRDVTYQIYSRDYIRRQIIDIAAKLAAEKPSLSRQISGSVLQIASEFGRIEASLAEMGYILTNLEVGSASLRGPTTFGKGYKAVWRGLGFQNQSAPGKLVMDFYGATSPYWIIGLEGNATEGSRSGMVEEEIMARFMEIARLYEIDVDCNNPFVFTDQRGGSCGAP
ncbi:hypothetical protein SUGI_0091250 [Cryptomeria japonica]|nr:hypothetical protein SUGI_0091250 [Cryptomeria japonica]